MRLTPFGFVAVLLLPACAAQQPEPESRLQREVEITERELDRMYDELDSIRVARQGIDSRIDQLAAAREARRDMAAAPAGEVVAGGEVALEPGAEAALSPADREIVSSQVYFGFDRAELTPGARAVLDQKIQVLQSNPNVQLFMTGHADERGSVQYNQRLSERRAAAVRQYLVSRGISADRLQTEGRGIHEPAALGRGEEVWRLNRRVEFEIR